MEHVEPAQIPLAVYILLSFIAVLVSIVGVFLMRLLDKFDSMDLKISDLDKKIVKLEVNFENFDKDINYIESLKKDLKNDMEEIVILKRDQASIWKRIDDLRMKVGELR